MPNEYNPVSAVKRAAVEAVEATKPVKGKKTLDDVPPHILEDVKKLLEDSNDG